MVYQYTTHLPTTDISGHVRYYIETDVDIVTWMYMVYTYMILYMLGVLLLVHIASLLVINVVIMVLLVVLVIIATRGWILSYWST